MCVECSYQIEILIQKRSPLLGVIALADWIDQRNATLVCPAENLHLRLLFGARWLRTIDNIEDGAAAQDWFQERTFLAEGFLSAMFRHKCFHHAPPFRGGRLVGLQPSEHLSWPFKTGRIYQDIEGFSGDYQWVFPTASCRTRHRINPHRVIRSERRDNTRLAAIHVSNNDKNGNVHKSSPARVSSGSTS